MTIYEIRVIAHKVGIDPRNKNKADLIKIIQLQKGQAPCFKTAEAYCDQAGCNWRSDCLKPKDAA